VVVVTVVVAVVVAVSEVMVVAAAAWASDSMGLGVEWWGNERMRGVSHLTPVSQFPKAREEKSPLLSVHHAPLLRGVLLSATMAGAVALPRRDTSPVESRWERA
jgi:hypothetical protein